MEARNRSAGLGIMMIGALLTLGGIAAHATDVTAGGVGVIVVGVLFALWG